VAHRGGVQAVKLVFELELVMRSMGQTGLIPVGEDGGEKTGGPTVVGVRKSGAGHRLDSQVVETLYPGFPASAVLGLQLAQNMSRNKVKHLMKDGVTMGLSQKSPFCLMGYA
jgi:hypothetical protein